MNNWSKFLKTAFLSLAIVAFANAAQGQGRVDQYKTTTFSASWNDISGTGTVFSLGDIHAWAGGYATISLPFDFNYDNTVVSAGTDITVSAGGAISFGDQTVNAVGIGDQGYPGTLGIFSGQAVVTGYGYSDYYGFGGYNGYGYYNSDYYEVDGSGSDQVFTIQLDNMHFVGDEGGGYNTSYLSSMQIKLYEATGVIEFIYQDHSHDFSYDYYENGCSIGLNGFTSPSFVSNSYSTGQTSTPSSDIRFTPPAPPAQLSLTPTSLNFGSVVPTSPVTMCVTASSVGSSPLHIRGYSLSGSSAYTIVSGPPIGTSIDPGNSVEYCIQFLPFSPGVATGSFTLITDGKDAGTQVVSLTGIGAIPAVSYGVTSLFRRVAVELTDTSQIQYIPVTSTGTGPLTFNSIYFIGLNANNYQVVRMPQNPLPPDATDSIGVQFTPTLEGRPDASIVINTDAFNNPHDTIALFGVGILQHLVITAPAPGSGNTVVFDSVAIGDSVCQTITLTNPGTDTLHILKQLVTYGDYDFTFYPLMGADTIILPGGGSQLVNICFKPLKQGTREASIRFYTDIPLTFESPRRDTSQFVVNVTGIGVPYGHLEFIGQLNDTAVVGNTNCLYDTLTNNGLTDLTLSSIAIAPKTSNFTISGITTPQTVAPGEKIPVRICFDATQRGSEFDTLMLAGTTSEKSISEALLLHGVGVVTCAAADSVAFFGVDSMTLVGSTDTSCITVTNCGDVPTVYTAAAGPGSGYTLLPPLTSATVPAGGTAEFCAAFTPTALGSSSGTVTITGGPANLTTRLAGVGAGVIASATGALTAPVTLGLCRAFTVTITNNGNVPWTPGAGTIGGTDAGDFTIQSGPTPSVIPVGGTADVVINFCPSAPARTETMTLTFPSASPMPITSFTFNGSGVGTTEGVTLKTEENGFSLGQCYPNPTNGTAEITVTLPFNAPVRIDIIDATGSVVRTAFTGNLPAGSQLVKLDAKGLPSGTYFYTLRSGDIRLARQLSLIR